MNLCEGYLPFLLTLPPLINRILKFNYSMNRLLLLFAAVIFPAIGFSQNGFQDVVYLKKGGFVKGVIVEQVPHKSVKLLLNDGTLAYFKVEEIEKFSKERYVEQMVEKKPRNSYVGFTVGLSQPFGSYANKSDAAATLGMHDNLVNVGILFTPEWGLAAAYFGGVNDYKTYTNPIYSNGIIASYKWNVWAYKGALIGPMYSHSLSDKLHIDLRVMGGYTELGLRRKYPNDPAFISQTSEDVTVAAIETGAMLRYDFSRLFSAMLVAEYFGCNPHLSVEGYSYRQPINTLSLGVGLAFRFPCFNTDWLTPLLTR